MSLRLFNSLSRQVETFVPMTPGQVRMYVCGMTIYDLCHVGHARMMMSFDVIQRWLKASGYAVNYVRNITDIDDKIIQRAAANGESIDALTARYIAAMHEDCATLGIAPPDHEPRATAHVPQIIAMIERLVAGGHALAGFHVLAIRIGQRQVAHDAGCGHAGVVAGFFGCHGRDIGLDRVGQRVHARGSGDGRGQAQQLQRFFHRHILQVQLDFSRARYAATRAGRYLHFANTEFPRAGENRRYG